MATVTVIRDSTWINYIYLPQKYTAKMDQYLIKFFCFYSHNIFGEFHVQNVIDHHFKGAQCVAYKEDGICLHKLANFGVKMLI